MVSESTSQARWRRESTEPAPSSGQPPEGNMPTSNSPTTPSTTLPLRATPAQVWPVMSAIERWPEWTPTVTRVEPLGDGPFRFGSRFRLHQPKLAPAVWEVIRLEEGRGFSWVTKHPGVRVTGEHWIEPTPDGCRVTLALRFEGFLAPLVARIYRSLNQRYLAQEAEGLRARCEG